MHSQIQYLPITPAFFAILVLAFGALIVLIQLGILRYAYMKLGVSSGTAMLLLLGSLVGSYFNIPITMLPGQVARSGEVIDFFGMQYVVPLVHQWPGTLLAVNIGGAVIPTIMSTYLVLRYQLWLRAVIAVLVIAVIIHAMATPVQGVGIAVRKGDNANRERINAAIDAIRASGKYKQIQDKYFNFDIYGPEAQ